MKHITVTEFNFYIASIISAEEMLRNLVIIGEVSGASVKDNNLYFTLKDNNASLPVACFGLRGGYVPKNGEKVLVTGSPDFYQRTGKLSFIAKKIEPVGKGELHERLEALKEKLKGEGLFESVHKKPIPRYAKSVGVVTSMQGAVIRDIISTIRRLNSIQDITVIDVKVQGANAAQSIIDGLLIADAQGFDVIILARGGGSFEELMPFNDETLARVIFSLDTPIISAVGHETDFSISDFVADMRALTPTAAAEAVAFCTRDIKASAVKLAKRGQSLVSFRLTDLANKIRYNMQSAYRLAESRAEAIISKISLLNPAALLEKGYFKISKDSGQTVNAIAELKEGEDIVIYGKGGAAEARVIKVKNEYPLKGAQ